MTTVPLSSDYPLTSDQISSYQRDGHILLRGVATAAEIAPFRALFMKAVEKRRKEMPALEARDAYGKAFIQTMNIWEFDEAVRPFVLSRRFGKIAADLMGVKGTRIYHDQALYKEGGGGNTPWHQDQYYWPFDEDTCITMWMPMIDVPAQMGTLRFASGSQRAGWLGEMPISEESEKHFQKLVKEKGWPVSPSMDMKAGDATFHSGWVLHSASGNASQTMREAMTIIWHADGMKVTLTEGRGDEDLKRWMPGAKRGGPAESKLNPLVYSR
jgi:ectoine hydroxylase-related dioxygenase (phytanoyl-CoA dioxygenase family)